MVLFVSGMAAGNVLTSCCIYYFFSDGGCGDGGRGRGGGVGGCGGGVVIIENLFLPMESLNFSSAIRPPKMNVWSMCSK